MTEETALTVQEQAERQLAVLLESDPNLLDMIGGEHLEEGDTGQPPQLKICQKEDPDLEVKPGHFYNTLTGESWEVLEIVPLMPLNVTRANYFKPYTKGEPLLCASDDGKMPREVSERRPLTNRQPGPCAMCPEAQWIDGARPACSRQRNFMLMVRDTSDVLSMMWQISAVPAARQLTALMKSAGIRKSVVLATKFTRGDSGDYYEPVVASGERLPTDELIGVIETRKEISRLIAEGRIVTEAEDTMDIDANGGGMPAVDNDDEDPLPF
jgi:hypothetical protein